MEVKLGHNEICQCIEYALIHDEHAPLRVTGKVQIELDRRSAQAFVRTGTHVKGEPANGDENLFDVTCGICGKKWQADDKRKTICSEECREESKRLTMQRANAKAGRSKK